MAEERVTRKLAAILATDMVGYSRLMEKDEEGTIARQKAQRSELIDPKFAEHGGRIVKSTGDGLLVEFASAVDAVKCAAEIQRAMVEREADVPEDRRIAYRAGINIGDIVIDGDDILGDGVNIAARLEAMAAPGGVCISGNVHEHVAGKLDLAFDDMGEQMVKNIERPVRAYRVQLEGTDQGNGSAATGQTDGRELSDKPSIAVLPFANLSSDLELGYLADGLTEDITTLLARIPGFLVIARTSTLGYRAEGIDIRKVGRELGARYVVEGSIRPVGGKVRVTVQLIEAAGGNHIWAEQFDRSAENVFSLQDELTAGIVGCLQPELTRAEVELVDRSRASNVDAWTLYRKASAAIFRLGWNKDGFEEGARLYREAIAKDPDFALAHGALSLTLAIGHVLGYVAAPDEAAEEAERALALSGNDSEVMGFAGCAISDLGDHDRGIDILERAIELNPSNAQAWVALGGALMPKGNFERAIEVLSHGIRISPRDPRLAIWSGMLALSLANHGRIEDGIAEARAACRVDQRLHNPRVVLATLLLRSGRSDEAAAALAEALRIKPDLAEREIAGVLLSEEEARTLFQIRTAMGQPASSLS